ncbi:MAG: MarR family transcriptional regulator [Acidiphilium sp.]|nr:MarR family transcriptional regulator [Acidiphilium sp.]MDD4935429.1 MarR family transcriptional regulator [Acidiphilium sp.]
MIEKFDKLKLDQQLCFALYAATHAITRVYRPYLTELKITYPQYIVLLVLVEHGETTVNGIATALKLDAATVTPLLKRLAEGDWITRERNHADGRVVRVQLTPKGKSLGDRLGEIQNKVRCRTGLDDMAFRNLRLMLTKLTDTLSP